MSTFCSIIPLTPFCIHHPSPGTAILSMSWIPLDLNPPLTVNPKEYQSWIFTGRIDAETKAPILWPHDVKSQHTEKDPDAGKDWGQEEKGATKDEVVGWPKWLNGHKFEQTPGDSEEQGSLACCSPRCRKEWDTIERLNNPLCILQDAPQSAELQCCICPKLKILHQLPLCTPWGPSSLVHYTSLLQSSPSAGTTT